VASSNWAYTDIAKAVKAGYLTGYEDGTIGANKLISRQEVAVIVNRKKYRYRSASGIF
jgi:hypothetical protein